MSNDAPTLELRGISKAFGSVQALSEVDFEVRDGEVMALVGDNGAGKSTLIKCVAGIYSIDSGEVLFEGEPVSTHGPKDAARLGIEIVYQDLHDIFEVATRITVLRLGRDVGVYEREKTTQREIVEAITAGVPTKVAGVAETEPAPA